MSIVIQVSAGCFRTPAFILAFHQQVHEHFFTCTFVAYFDLCQQHAETTQITTQQADCRKESWENENAAGA